VPLVDPAAVSLAREIGIGGETIFNLGGTIDCRNSQVSLYATVIAVFVDSVVMYEDGTSGRCGDVAVLQVDQIQILLTSRTAWFVGKQIFTEHGISLEDKNVIVVKSPNGFRTYYEAIADRILVADGEGCTSANLWRLPYSRVLRPIYPLDELSNPRLTVNLTKFTR
jgi:microcystin degradation protein MlrC